MNKHIKSAQFFLLTFFLLFFCISCSDSDNEESLSSEKQIIQFKISSVSGIIDEQQKSISVTLPYGTNVTELVPEFVLSEKATANPASGVVQDFTNPVKYIVTAEDKSKVTYEVRVILEELDKTNFLDFSIEGIKADIDHIRGIVSFSLPALTDITNIAPDFIVAEGSSVSPALGEPQDFTNPVVYTVTDADGKEKKYKITIVVEKNDEADITSVQKIEGAEISGATISTEEMKVDIRVRHGSILTSLKPIVTLSQGATITPDTPQDFTNPVTYTVTAESGRQVQYIFTVTPDDAPAIGLHSMTLFSHWAGSTDSEYLRSHGVIDDVNKTVKFNIPTDESWDVRYFEPKYIAFYGTTVSPASGVVDFTNPVTYTLTGQDGKEEKYTVSVTKMPYRPIYLSKVSNMRPVVGEILTLTGTFAPSGGHKVQFIHSWPNNTVFDAKIISESATEIKVETPKGAGAAWKYDIRIEVDNMSQKREGIVYY